MADARIPIDYSAVSPANTRLFGLALSGKERAPRALAHAICLRVAFLALLAYGVGSAALLVATSARLIPNQWENTYPESPHVYVAIRAALTGRLYYPFTQPPYTLQPYGPLFYEMNAALARISHAGVEQFVQLARIANFSSFLLCGVAVFLICRRLKFSALASFAAAALPLGIPIFCEANVTIRPDMHYLLAMLLSLLVAVWVESPPAWVCVLSGAIGGVAFLMKQPGIAVLIAIALVWLVHKKLRNVALLAVGAALPVILMLLLLLWHKEQFVDQFFTVGRVLRSVPDAVSYTLSVLLNLTLLLPMGIGILGFARAVRSTERAQLIASFTFVNWLVGFAGMPQVGAAPNYFFAGLMGCGLLLPFALESVQDRVKSAAVLAIIGLGMCYVGTVDAREMSGILAAKANFTPAPYQALSQFHILSDRPVFALHGQDPDLLDPLSNHLIELGSGGWTSAPIEASLRHGDYDLVILACTGTRLVCTFRGVNFFGPGVIQAINQNYSVFCTNRNAIVLTPRSRHVDVTAAMLDPALNAACDTRYQGHAPDLVTLAGTK